MISRRAFIKGGGATVIGGLAGAALSSCTTQGAAVELSDIDPVVAATDNVQFRPGGAGPLYWSTYGYEYLENVLIPEDVWKANVDWVADTFRDYGYTMVCTDGWIDDTQHITPHGYIVSQADDWEHDWAWWVNYLKGKGLQLGVYYNPLWATKSAVTNPDVTVVGRPDIKVGDLVNPGDNFDGGGRLQWVDATRDGAEEYIKGYVSYFRELGVVFLRMDFLAWYEVGFDQSEGTVGAAHGRDSYLQALAWMREAAGDMQLSLVMPNLFDHGAGERRFGDLVRIDNDASFGTWINLSEGPQSWQPIWSQWNNPFLGFTGFSDVSGRGQLILDGDPLLISSFANDDERQSAVNLFIMAGAPIAICDRQDTIGDSAAIFQNREVLAVRQAGLVGKPIYHNCHDFFYDTSSRDPERWIGQLPDGSWVVGLFNRGNGPGPSTRSIEFASELGLVGPAAVRDLWAHRDLGSMTDWTIDLQPHQSSLVKITPSGPARYAAEVGAWSGTARFENTFAGHQGLGYVTGLDTPESSVSVAVSVAKAGRHTLSCRVANATGGPSSLNVYATDPGNGKQFGSARLTVSSTPVWTTWQTIPLQLDLGPGVNLITVATGDGSVNVDFVELSNS